VLLAAQPASYRVQWLKHSQRAAHTQHTLVEATALAQRLVQVELAGYALASEEHEWGVHAVAVPVRHASGQAVAALNLIANAQVARLGDWPHRYVPAMREVAQRLGAVAPSRTDTARTMPDGGA
jgi:IclR family pca regulon transcriptional regulator